MHNILSELVMGGMVLETNMTEIMTRIEEQNKLEKQEVIKSLRLAYYWSADAVTQIRQMIACIFGQDSSW